MSEFIRACRCEPTAYTPIWLMRQAGRYQPEYRALRQEFSFIDLCKTPELAAQVTILPVQQFKLDAAIIFADILLLLEPLKIGFTFTENQGPKILTPVRSSQEIDRMSERIDVHRSLGYVLQAIRIVTSELSQHVPLIGFSGAPFTLASYIIEGGGSRDYLNTKRLMFKDPSAWEVLMTKLTNAIVEYLNAQVEAGVQALQIFDSWIGCLNQWNYKKYVFPYMKKLFNALNPNIPVIHFGTGNPALYLPMSQAGGDVIGIDWRVELSTQWNLLGKVSIMGNLDPASLLAPKDVLEMHARRILDEASGRPGHIFNLGHGVYPQTNPDNVRALVDFVHEQSNR